MHGHIGDSLSLNPLGPLTLIAAMLFVVGIHNRFPALAKRLQSRPVVGAFIGIWVAVWIIRLQVARQ
jgi:hypothetical protein